MGSGTAAADDGRRIRATLLVIQSRRTARFRWFTCSSTQRIINSNRGCASCCNDVTPRFTHERESDIRARLLEIRQNEREAFRGQVQQLHIRCDARSRVFLWRNKFRRVWIQGHDSMRLPSPNFGTTAARETQQPLETVLHSAVKVRARREWLSKALSARTRWRTRGRPNGTFCGEFFLLHAHHSAQCSERG